MVATMTLPMSWSFPYPFIFPLPDVDNTTTISGTMLPSYPSPPVSTSSDPGLDFDLESFTDDSLLLDDPLSRDFASLPSAFLAQPNVKNTNNHNTVAAAAALSPSTSSAFSAPTPTSTTIISPKSSISSIADVGGNGLGLSSSTFLPLASQPSSADTAEALSNHHLQRYLHYKALAAQAEADARAAAALQSQQDFEALLASCNFPVVGSAAGGGGGYDAPKVEEMFMPHNQHQHNMCDYATPQYLAYNPNQQASLAHAQAEAHLQAHDVAAARAQHQRSQTSYWVASTQNAFDMAQPVPVSVPAQAQATVAPLPQQSWSRASISGSVSAQSPPFPLTPNSVVPSLPLPVSTSTGIASFPVTPEAISSVSQPVSAPPSAPPIEGEEELDHDDDKSASALSTWTSPSSENIPIPNLHGGGRGYIPGQTPDDPKKRHKCGICGRGFARAFNLKSHIQTHNLVRSKPHQCPHSTCKRGFSRLHDLERHRQGIHNDGPLVDINNIKAKGVTPSATRAQKRVTCGTLNNKETFLGRCSNE